MEDGSHRCLELDAALERLTAISLGDLPQKAAPERSIPRYVHDACRDSLAFIGCMRAPQFEEWSYPV